MQNSIFGLKFWQQLIVKPNPELVGDVAHESIGRVEKSTNMVKFQNQKEVSSVVLVTYNRLMSKHPKLEFCIVNLNSRVEQSIAQGCKINRMFSN